MTDSVHVEAPDYPKVAAALKASDRKVATVARRELRDAARPIGEFVLAEMAEVMPRRGGYADRLRAAAVKPYVTARGAGVGLMHRGVDVRSLERGILRHPKWPGDRPRSDWRWDEQPVPAGTAAAALEHLPAGQRQRLDKVADRIIKELGV